MTAKEAKEIADEQNAPLIKKFWLKNPFESFFLDAIAIDAKKGNYHSDFSIPSKHYSMAVAKDAYEKLTAIGYNVEVEILDSEKTENQENEISGWVLRVRWD